MAQIEREVVVYRVIAVAEDLHIVGDDDDAIVQTAEQLARQGEFDFKLMEQSQQPDRKYFAVIFIPNGNGTEHQEVKLGNDFGFQVQGQITKMEVAEDGTRIIKGFKLMGASLVTHPPNSDCRIDLKAVSEALEPAVRAEPEPPPDPKPPPERVPEDRDSDEKNLDRSDADH